MEPKILQSIEDAAGVASAIVTRFGHPSVGSLLNEIPSLVPVFAGFADVIIGLFRHSQAAKPAA